MRIQQDDYGDVLRVIVTDKFDNTVRDLSEFTTRQFIILLPDKTVREVTATFETDGTDGVLNYTLTPTDTEQIGRCKVQAKLTATGKQISTSFAEYTVERNLTE